MSGSGIAPLNQSKGVRPISEARGSSSSPVPPSSQRPNVAMNVRSLSTVPVNPVPAAPVVTEEITPFEEDEVLFTDVSKVKYRKGTVAQDEMVSFLDSAKAGCKETRRTQLFSNFFNFICSIIGAEITSKDAMKLEDIYFTAFGKYVAMDDANYKAIIHSGHGLWAAVVDPKIPDFVSQKSKVFITSKGKTGLDEDQARKDKGKLIWTTYQKTKAFVVNYANPLVRDIKSGENKTGLLLEYREKLWHLEENRKRHDRLIRLASAASPNAKGQFIYITFIYVYRVSLNF